MRKETLQIIKNLNKNFKGEYVYDMGGGYNPVTSDIVGNKKIKVVDYFSGPKVDIIDDLTKLNSIESNSVDNIFCSDALEHVIEPWNAIKQFHRVLKNDGILFVTVPFIWHFHGHEIQKENWKSRVDFWRFTPQALESLCFKYFEKIDCNWDLEPPLGPQELPIWRCGVYYMGKKLSSIRKEDYTLEITRDNW
jgi:SAM-dependent methyltransferase